MTHPYFDDHRVRKEHALQLQLKQFAPPLLDGGRAILWFCHLCQKPWFEMGRRASFVCLSISQLAEIGQQLGAWIGNISTLPASICPLCASLHLGGIPTIEEYLDGQGYRFTWEARTARNTRLFSIVYRWNTSSTSEMVSKVGSAPCDVLTGSMEQMRSMLAWLKTLAEPDQEEAVFLSECTLERMSRYETPPPGFAWSSHGWKARCPLLGQVLVVLGMTFPTSSICSPSLQVACWRQIAHQIERVLIC
jgi:hypothetical protein